MSAAQSCIYTVSFSVQTADMGYIAFRELEIKVKGISEMWHGSVKCNMWETSQFFFWLPIVLISDSPMELPRPFFYENNDNLSLFWPQCTCLSLYLMRVI